MANCYCMGGVMSYSGKEKRKSLYLDWSVPVTLIITIFLSAGSLGIIGIWYAAQTYSLVHDNTRRILAAEQELNRRAAVLNKVYVIENDVRHTKDVIIMVSKKVDKLLGVD